MICTSQDFRLGRISDIKTSRKEEHISAEKADFGNVPRKKTTSHERTPNYGVAIEGAMVPPWTWSRLPWS